MVTTWNQATSLEKLDSHSYKVALRSDWCNGTVPHGGYIVSCFMRAVTAHFRDTLKRNQPHTMTLHVEFTRRTQIGPASIVIRDVKLGGRLSTVHVALIQQGKEGLYSKPYDVDLSKLKVRQDNRWVEPYQGLMLHRHVRTFTPSKGQFLSGMVDQWICGNDAGDGSRFTNETLGYIADVFYVKPKFTIFSLATLGLNLDIRKAIPSEGLEW